MDSRDIGGLIGRFIANRENILLLPDFTFEVGDAGIPWAECDWAIEVADTRSRSICNSIDTRTKVVKPKRKCILESLSTKNVIS